MGSIPANRLATPMAFALAAVACDAVMAEDRRFEVGLRGLVIIGDGEPANDMIGYGAIGRLELGDPWYLAVALDSVAFDYETPYRILGIDSVEEIDPKNEFTRLSIAVERRYGRPDSPWGWYWTAGAGYAFVDVGENAAGVTPGGQAFEIATTAEDEWHVIAGAGLRRSLGQNWTLDAALTLQHHTTDYRLVDLVSGAMGSTGSQTPYGVALGVSYGF
jgi:hypothetical protein